MFTKNKLNTIYNYAEKIIMNEGIRKLNISDMCTNLGISKKTFYKEFESKENFIKKFYFEKLSGVYISLVSAIQNQDTFADKINNISNVIKKNMPIFNSKKINEIGESYPQILEHINKFKNNRVIPLLYLLIRKAQKHNILNKYDPTIMLHVFFTVISSIYDSKKTLNIGENIKFNDALHILLNGILTKKVKGFLNNKLVNIN